MATTNVAYLLATRIAQLDVPPGTAPQSLRGFAQGEDREAWSRFVLDIQLVQAVDAEVSALEDEAGGTTVFSPSVEHWYAAVGMAKTPWNSVSDSLKPACSTVHMNMLTALGMLLEHRPRVAISTDEERTLADVIDMARGLLDDDELMDPHVKRYLQGLLDRASWLLENIETFGAEPIRAVALEIAGAMYTRADVEPDPEKQSRWKSAAWGMVGGFMTTTGGEGAKALGRAAVEGIKQIGN